MNLSGKCYCGGCSWTTSGALNWVGTCHCTSCRRNCAAPFTTFFGIGNDLWEWTGSAPKTLSTCPGVTRYFCDNCGTPMAYHNTKWNHETHFYVASLDDPEVLQPQFHVHWQERLSWLAIDDDLPKYAASVSEGSDG